MRRAAALTAKRASAVADNISIAHSTVSIGGRREVTRVLKADLQHVLEREGIAFIDERHKFAVVAIMSRRLGKMKSHEGGKSINLGDRHRSNSSELGERFVKESHVLGERIRGVIFERHALLKTAHNKLVGDSSACTRKRSKHPFPGKGTTSGGRVIVSGEHGEGPKDLVAVLSVFQSQCWMIASAPKTYEVRKDCRIAVWSFFSSAERVGHSITGSFDVDRPFIDLTETKSNDEPAKARAEVGQEVTAEPEQVTDTSNRFRVNVLNPKILEDLLAILVVIQGCESRLQVALRFDSRKRRA